MGKGAEVGEEGRAERIDAEGKGARGRSENRDGREGLDGET